MRTPRVRTRSKLAAFVAALTIVATFSVDITGTPLIEERAVVPTDRHWLLEDGVSSERAHAAAPRIGAALGSAARALS